MTKYKYYNTRDKKLIEDAFNNIAWLVFGKNAIDKIDAFSELFDMYVKEVNIYPQGTKQEYVNTYCPGVCRLDTADNKLVIEMLGFANANPSQYTFIEHEATHEFSHSFVDLLPLIFSKNDNGYIQNGVRYKNHMGLIEEKNERTGKLVGHHYYGKMFNETMMDIISTIGLVSFDDNFTGHITADDVLKKDYTHWENAKTGYSMFTSITRLAIAAFSNNGFVNYDQIIKSGNGIFDVDTTTMNGTSLKANDFLYGIMFDPMHIEREFDKFMGDGSYRKFAHYVDALFAILQQQRKHEIPVHDVKKIMNILPDFLNKKCQYYLQNGIMNQNQISAIIGNFNKIWNSMQQEYSAYFSQREIDRIAKRAGR